MPTSLFQQLPWTGGVNTSLDPALIRPDQLTVADNVVFPTSMSKKKREGIAHNWDSNSSSTNSVVGLHDFWYGSTTRSQRILGILSSCVVNSYNGGTAATLADSGVAWTGTLTAAAAASFNNKAILAVDGANNVMKYWDGTNKLRDMQNSLGVATVARASSGTTRTLQFNLAFPGIVGSTIIVDSMANDAYNGTFTVATITTTTLANDTITFVGASALTEALTPDTAGLVGTNTVPQASVLRSHMGRLWCNDKLNPDRLHYCQAFDHTKWLGIGDSGAIDIGVGDGDPVGITAIFPTFKGDLFIAKKTKLYRVSGPTPDLMSVELVSNGVGCVAHNSVATVDQDDVMWVSEKGVHSLSAAASYGDFTSEYLSSDIQKTFNEGFDRSRLRYCWAAYLSSINSVAFSFTETSASNRTLTTPAVNNALWLYNIPNKAWYRWYDLPCQSLIVANDADKKRFYLGTHTGRVSKTQTGSLFDVSAAGVQMAVQWRVVTGQIFVDQSPWTVKGFKSFVLYYRPSGTHNIAVNVLVDNFTLDPNNSKAFSQASTTALLGTSGFVLGTPGATLGYQTVLGPYSGSIDGYGRGVQLEMIENGINEDADIQGFGIVWEPAGSAGEVVLRQ